MAPRKDSIPHETRTAAEPRQNKLYTVRLAHIEQINPTIRLLRLSLPTDQPLDDESSDAQPQEPFSFLPGQWLDVHVPGIAQAGGFTITSTPADAQPLPIPDPTVIQDGTEELAGQHGEIGSPFPALFNGRYPYVELAVQNSPSNPPAAWLWRPAKEIQGRQLNVRVGGSFVWPPAAVMAAGEVRNIVLVAAGVGINPLISILSHLTEPSSTPKDRADPLRIHFLYATRVPLETESSGNQKSAKHTTLTLAALENILFLPRLCQIVQRVSDIKHLPTIHLTLDLFLTNATESAASQACKMLEESTGSMKNIRVHSRRVSKDDLYNVTTATSPSDRTVCYVCGPPPMTDEFVSHLATLVGTDRVLCEKWW